MTTSVRITTEYITLTQLLKEENIISSGGQAKYYLMDFPVLLNGETENRRGKKLYDHDEIVIDGETYVIELAENAEELIAEAETQRAERAMNAKKTVRDDRIKAQKAAAAKARKEARFAELRKKNRTRAGGFGRSTNKPKGPGSWNSNR
ncbi:S4 domain-containing protein YaaA [Leuconostoc suionicum]|uniref:S4 domain-containing protein YaaA n=1 Tax=Leuconostoc suionicum TaxID=1511761 RepID=UPI0021AA9C25|nr:S4 domain-containing protein YaaA [Leuconostoc suionicum]MCT4383169.1 S4 domain-containing protein YaaA [Leuconostoc suionicum]MDC2806325.1 S4 domain-containing protein YaaA [Leuconostoc suionicum]MDC2816921.1 S4 domain-containing protein YaaA [Leuconostoc suionicum]MDC2823837.1 S4 domain-containing protein YaaA [Leuconostoc suionicum]